MAVSVVNEMRGMLRLEKHPDKAFIGRIERGFDFLGVISVGRTDRGCEDGYELHREGILALRARAPRGFSRAALEMYVRRWVRWTTSGRGDLVGQRTSIAALVRAYPFAKDEYSLTPECLFAEVQTSLQSLGMPPFCFHFSEGAALHGPTFLY